MRQKGEIRGGPNTPEVTKAREDRAAKRKQRQELRSGNADRARAAGETIMAGKKTKKKAGPYLKELRRRDLRNRTIRNQRKRTANVVRRNTPSGVRPSDSSSILVGGLTEQMKMKLRQRMLEDLQTPERAREMKDAVAVARRRAETARPGMDALLTGEIANSVEARNRMETNDPKLVYGKGGRVVGKVVPTKGSKRAK